MKTITALIGIITPLMLAIHVSTARLFRAWETGTASPLARWLPPRRVLRIEALYWALALLAWTLWRNPGWKGIVAAFAAIHLASWLAGELHSSGTASLGQAGRRLPPKLKRAVIGFDLVEVIVLGAVGWAALRYVLGAVVH